MRRKIAILAAINSRSEYYDRTYSRSGQEEEQTGEYKLPVPMRNLIYAIIFIARIFSSFAT